MISTLVRGLALATVAAGVLPAVASADGEAGYVTRNANILQFVAYGGYDNDLRVSMDGNSVIFKDAAGPILRSTLSCSYITGAGASCVVPGPTILSIHLGDGKNKVISNVPDDDITNVVIDGGAGSTSNHLEHSGRPAEIHGGPGPDTLIGGNASDALVGGEGNDLLRPRLGSDAVEGGEGVDEASYSDRLIGALNISLDDDDNDGVQGEHDNVRTENVTGGSGYDVITGNLFANKLSGGPGKDELHGGGSVDSLFGGANDDTMEGGPGDDTESGGAGNDRFVANPGGDRLIGGLGYDLADYSARTSAITADIDAQADDGGETEGDLAQVENLLGGSGNDSLIGGAGVNILRGGPGADSVDGRGGMDQLFGGSGADAMLAKDGVADLVDCGTELDSVDADTVDTLVECASGAGTGGGGGATGGAGGGSGAGAGGGTLPNGAPRIAISPRKPRLRGRRIVLRVSCPSSAAEACSGRLTLRTGKGRRVGAKTFRVVAGRSGKVSIRLARGARLRVLRRGVLALKLSVTARDAASSSATSGVRLRVRAPLGAS